MKLLTAVLMAALVVACPSCATGSKAPAPGRSRTPFIWPLEEPSAAISSKFGLRGEGPAARHHNGVDIPAPRRTPVLAAADGYVMFSGRAGSYGKAVKIAHTDGIETCYAHLSKCVAKKGNSVRQGQVIGKVGKSGRADGHHLHYEVRLYGGPVDPERYLPPRQQPAQ